MLRLFYVIFIYLSLILLSNNKVNAQVDEKVLLLETYEYRNIDSLNSFINNFPIESPYVQEAIRIRDQMAYEKAKRENTIKAYQEFEKLYPNALQISQVKRWISNNILKSTIEEGNSENLRELLKSSSDTSIIKRAEKEIEKLVFEKSREINTIDSYNNYLNKYPLGNYSKLANEYLEDLQFNKYISSYDIDELIYFLLNFPSHNKHRQVYDTLIYITKDKNSIIGMEYLYNNNKYEINFQPFLISFALEYVRDGNLNSYEEVISKFPKLINVRAFAKNLKEAKDINTLISLINIDENTYKKYSSYFNTIINDKSLVLIKKYYSSLVSQRKTSQANKYLNSMDYDFRVYEFKESINKPIPTKPNDQNISFTRDSSIMVYSQEKLNNYGNKDIYIAFKEDNYSSSILLPKIINSKYDEFNPSISLQGDAIYFYSDNGMNIGEYDLYISFRANKDSYLDWTLPIKANNIDLKNIRELYSIGHVINQDNEPVEADIFVDDSINAQRLNRTKSNPITGSFAFLRPSKPFISISSKQGSISSYFRGMDNIILKENEVEKLISRHQLLTIPSVFDTINPDKLSKSNENFLRYMANSLKNINYSLTISVHTQQRYKHMDDEDLSSLQAGIIKDKLISFGMNSSKIVVAGYGKRSPLIGWEGKNRIEIGFINLQNE